MARPLKPIDEEQVYSLALRAWTNKEIAYRFGVNEDTLIRRFSETLKEARANRDGSLREKQYEVAMAGNTTMLIWLGKQMLFQKELLEVKDVSVKEAIDRGKHYLRSLGRSNGDPLTSAGLPGPADLVQYDLPGEGHA